MTAPTVRARAPWLASMLAASLSLAACAAFRTPVDVLDTPTPSTTSPSATHSPDAPDTTAGPENALGLYIEPLRGTPEGLVLRLSSRVRAPGDTSLHLVRHDPDGTARMLLEVTLDRRDAERLYDGRIDFLDAELPAAGLYAYELVAQIPDGASHAPQATVRWYEPPPPVADLRVVQATAAGDGGRVVLEWPHVGRFDAMVLRRDIVDGQVRPGVLARLDGAAGGHFVDHSVEAGGVYAYQVVFVEPRASVPQYGRASDELYATVPAGDP